MIFVTVGSQLPFDRLVKAVIRWSIENRYDDVVFQVGPGGYVLNDNRFHELLGTDQFNKYFQEADLIIAHAGMGSILKALEINRPIIIMARLLEKKEHRNNHQVATIQKFSKYPGLITIENEEELPSAIEKCSVSKKKENKYIFKSSNLTNHIKNYIESTLKKS